MDKLEDFKSIADEIMSDINVGEDLKRRTLAQCKKKNYAFAGRVLIPAACLLLTLGFLNLSGILPIKSPVKQEENTEINLLADNTQDTAKVTETAPESAASSIVQDSPQENTWRLNTMEEAGEIFGSAFLTPDYLPEKYQLDGIQAFGADRSSADKIILSYQSGEQSIYITEEKSASQEGVSGYEAISMDGFTGYIKELQPGDEAGTGDQYIELHWYKEEIHYSISGQLTREEAVKVAKAMS